jgi:hypothetical protein
MIHDEEMLTTEALSKEKEELNAMPKFRGFTQGQKVLHLKRAGSPTNLNLLGQLKALLENDYFLA